MTTKPQTVIPADFPIRRVNHRTKSGELVLRTDASGRPIVKAAKGTEPTLMRAKGTGVPSEAKLLRPDATTGSAIVANIKRKARIARTTSEDVARALCAIRSGEVKVL